VTDDPYCWPDSDCLRNKLGIRNKERLVQAEARLVSARDVLVARWPIPGEYNLEHLKSFHLQLFQDVYDWAGETRTVDLSRPDSRFAHWRYVDEEVSSLLYRLGSQDGLLIGLRRPSFVEHLAFYYGEINARHAFREGNGRTQRSFLRQLSAAAGWNVDWSGLDPAENEEACRVNLATGATEPLMTILNRVVSRM
jgi:cell filamentation protein